ncbi:MAG: polysaccharide biosynthesis/export family protein [Candidatus Acidiferrales bacterium]
MMRKISTGLFLTLALGMTCAVRPLNASPAGGQNLEPVKAKGPSTDGPAVRYPRYLLRPSDVLDITFPITPDFDQSVVIQPDGYVSLRNIGDLHVAGMSVPELSATLKKDYGQFLHDPIINVELKDFEKPYFVAGGEFGHPGKYELRDDTTVAEAVAIAGGFTDRAKHSDVYLFRRVPGGWSQARRLDVKRMMANGDLTEDIHLQPGDLIFVPQNKLSKIRSFIPNTGLGMTIP